MAKKSTTKSPVPKTSKLKQFLAFVVLFGSLELIMANTSFMRWTLLITGVVLFLYILWIAGFRVWHADSLNKMILPLLFCGGAVAFLIIIPSPLLAHLYSLVVSIIYIMLVKNVGKKNKGEQIVDGFRVNDTALLVCSFLIFSSLFALYIFLYLQSWLLLAALAVVAMIMIYQYFWQEQFLNEKTWLFIPVLGLIFAELGWALTFWPTSFVSRGVVLFVFFYCFLGMVKLHFNDRLVLVTARKYLVVSVLVLSLVLGTTQWLY
ncbi:hypothetical protein KJ903_04350 [Patescibacteria group bacterium]|nr:hypothetical protein [Patescibacteria group bacterium]